MSVLFYQIQACPDDGTLIHWTYVDDHSVEILSQTAEHNYFADNSEGENWRKRGYVLRQWGSCLNETTPMTGSDPRHSRMDFGPSW